MKTRKKHTFARAVKRRLAEAIAWKLTHKDYRASGKRVAMWSPKGTTLVALKDLTDAELVSYTPETAGLLK